MAREKPDYGKAVVDGKIRYTSVSALQTFDPLTYGGCPRRWYFKYVERRPEPQTKATQLGTEIHEQLEHYLTRGEDVLSPIARAGRHLLPKPGNDLAIEQTFGDTKKAIALCETYEVSHRPPWFSAEIEHLAGLTVAGIPMAGFIDVRHTRGEYIDEDGTLRQEKYPNTTEVIDHKSTSNLDYAKSAEALSKSIQMVGYANVKVIRENSDFIRLSHINYQTRGARAAKKVTTLISTRDALQEWQRVESVARFMLDVAKADKPDIVDFQLDSCGAYRVGCPHTAYCNRPQRNILDLLQSESDRTFKKESKERGNTMSTGGLFDVKPTGNGVGKNSGLFGAGTSVPAIPTSMSDSQRQATVEAEKTRLRAEDKRHPLEQLEGYTVGQPCNGRGFYVHHNGQAFIGVEVGHLCDACNIPAAPQHIGSINPPDAPRVDPIMEAEPLAPEVISKIEDPVLKATAEAHAVAYAERKAAMIANSNGTTKEKTGGRCSAGGQRLALTQKEAASKRKICPACSKEVKIKPSEDFTETVLPAHNMTPVGEAAAPALPEKKMKIIDGETGKELVIVPVAPVITTAVVPPPLPSIAYAHCPTLPTSPSVVTTTLAAPGAPPSETVNLPMITQSTLQPTLPVETITNDTNGITLYVDVLFEKGEQPISLDTYINDMVRTIEQKANVPDLRCAPDKHEIAFGRWKGYLAACVRFDPPKPGVYIVHGSAASEIKQVVIEALAPMCEKVVRGAR